MRDRHSGGWLSLGKSSLGPDARQAPKWSGRISANKY